MTIRWAFVDFKTTEFATLALTNPRNHSLDGRALVVEYASPDAVRRSGLGRSQGLSEEPSTEVSRPNRASRRLPKAERLAAKSAERGTKEAVADDDDEIPASEEAHKKGHEARPTATATVLIRKGKRAKPGAALASAPRESGAIVISTGKKIIF